MKMKMVKARVKNGKIEIDFEGFPDKTCDIEELMMRSILEKMGVETNDQYGERKKSEKEPTDEREKVCV